jgi:uncharacterized protein YndB with AHSA1/START domain
VTETAITESTSTTTDRLVFQIYIRATQDQVWEAITQTEFRRQYFYGSTIESTFEPGSSLRSLGPEGELWEDDTVLECEPPRLLSHTWRSLWDPSAADEPPSRVTWTVEAQDGGFTKLTVVHDQLEKSPATAQSVSGGWAFIISGLKSVLETGAPLTGPQD